MGEEDNQTPFFPTHMQEKRTGDVWSASAYILTATFGTGVLVIAWSVAELGWIGGPISILMFAGISAVSAFLLCDCYKSPDPEYGPITNHTYMDAVRLNLGRKSIWVCGLCQQVSLYFDTIAFTLTASISMRAIPRSNCFHKEGHEASCAYGDKFYILLFGAVQIFVSQIPDFHNMAWLSILATVMCFFYSFIGLGLGFAKVVGDGQIKGSIGGISQATELKKVWTTSQALGNIAFGFPFSIILFEIQDTLKSTPAENRTMKKASIIAISVTTFFYICCGCFAYAAFGDNIPGNLFAGFGFYEPFWLLDFANACIVIFLVGGYQVISQPVFAFVEGWLAEKFPYNGFINKFYTIKIPLLPAFNLNLLRLCFRTALVSSSTGIAVVFPYFNEVLGVVGSIQFWPLVIYFPVEMYLVQTKIVAWTRSWVLLRAYSYFCLLLSIYAFTGSVQGLISAEIS